MSIVQLSDSDRVQNSSAYLSYMFNDQFDIVNLSLPKWQLVLTMHPTRPISPYISSPSEFLVIDLMLFIPIARMVSIGFTKAIDMEVDSPR
jgi:hypothetical protein